MKCLACGAEIITCLTPSGRVVDLDPEHVWISLQSPWPTGLFRLAAMGGGNGPAVPAAMPVIETQLRSSYAHGTHAGPFRREHRCPRTEEAQRSSPA